MCVCLSCEILSSELRLANMDVTSSYDRKFKKEIDFFPLKITTNG